MSHLKPYSAEWHRKRFLREAIDKYLDDYVSTEVILSDILDILHEKSTAAFKEFEYINNLEAKIYNIQ